MDERPSRIVRLKELEDFKLKISSLKSEYILEKIKNKPCLLHTRSKSIVLVHNRQPKHAIHALDNTLFFIPTLID